MGQSRCRESGVQRIEEVGSEGSCEERQQDWGRQLIDNCFEVIMKQFKVSLARCGVNVTGEAEELYSYL